MIDAEVRVQIRRYFYGEHWKARESARSGRLDLAVPENTVLLERAFAEGESAAQQSAQLLDLLDRNGVRAMRCALREALERNTPRLFGSFSAAPVQSRHAASAGSEPPSAGPDPLHDLETYDELAHRRDEEPES